MATLIALWMCCSCSEGFRLLSVSICCQHFALLRGIIWSFHCLLKRTSALSFVTPGDQKLLFVNFAQLLHERSTSDSSDGRTPCACTTCSPYVRKDHQTTCVGLLVFGWETTISSFLAVAAGCGLSWWQLFSLCFFSGCLFRGCFLHRTNCECHAGLLGLFHALIQNPISEKPFWDSDNQVLYSCWDVKKTKINTTQLCFYLEKSDMKANKVIQNNLRGQLGVTSFASKTTVRIKIKSTSQKILEKWKKHIRIPKHKSKKVYKSIPEKQEIW